MRTAPQRNAKARPTIGYPTHEIGTDGFTLIELLVSVAVIALLMALLLPSVSKARARGRAAKCAGELHVVAQGVISYVAEFNGVVPSSIPYPLGTFNSSGVVCPETLYYPDNAAGLQYGYFRAAPFYSQVLKSDDCVLATDAAQFSQNYGAAGAYSLRMDGWSPFVLPWISATDNLIVDCKLFPLTIGGNTNQISSNVLFHGRHANTGNVAWYDGHVSAELPYIADLWKPKFKQYNLGGLTPVPHNLSSNDFLAQPPTFLNRYFLPR